MSSVGCPFQAICAAFWQGIEQRQFDETPGAAAVGVVRTEVGHDGDLYTAQVAVLASSRPMDRDQTIVLHTAISRMHRAAHDGASCQR